MFLLALIEFVSIMIFNHCASEDIQRNIVIIITHFNAYIIVDKIYVYQFISIRNMFSVYMDFQQWFFGKQLLILLFWILRYCYVSMVQHLKLVKISNLIENKIKNPINR